MTANHLWSLDLFERNQKNKASYLTKAKTLKSSWATSVSRENLRFELVEKNIIQEHENELTTLIKKNNSDNKPVVLRYSDEIANLINFSQYIKDNIAGDLLDTEDSAEESYSSYVKEESEGASSTITDNLHWDFLNLDIITQNYRNIGGVSLERAQEFISQDMNILVEQANQLVTNIEEHANISKKTVFENTKFAKSQAELDKIITLQEEMYSKIGEIDDLLKRYLDDLSRISRKIDKPHEQITPVLEASTINPQSETEAGFDELCKRLEGKQLELIIIIEHLLQLGKKIYKRNNRIKARKEFFSGIGHFLQGVFEFIAPAIPYILGAILVAALLWGGYLFVAWLIELIVEALTNFWNWLVDLWFAFWDFLWTAFLWLVGISIAGGLIAGIIAGISSALFGD